MKNMKKLSILGLSLIAAALTTNAATAKINPPKERKNEVITSLVRFDKPLSLTSVRIFGPLPIPVPYVTLTNQRTGETIVTDDRGNGIINAIVGDIITALARNGHKGSVTVTAERFSRTTTIYVYRRS